MKRKVWVIGTGNSCHPQMAEAIIDAHWGDHWEAASAGTDLAETCPIWPEQGKRAHFGFPDLTQAKGTDAEIMDVFRQVRDDIIGAFCPF